MSVSYTHLCYPNGSMIQATNGNFYGTTIYGDTAGGCYLTPGTIFSITSGGTLTTVCLLYTSRCV